MKTRIQKEKKLQAINAKLKKGKDAFVGVSIETGAINGILYSFKSKVVKLPNINSGIPSYYAKALFDNCKRDIKRFKTLDLETQRDGIRQLAKQSEMFNMMSAETIVQAPKTNNYEKRLSLNNGIFKPEMFVNDEYNL